MTRKRLPSILLHLATALCLLLCLCIVMAWFTSRRGQRVLWWMHSDSLPHFHVAYVHNGRIMLAHYRGTSISPMDQKFKNAIALEPINRARIEEYKAKFQRLADSDAAEDERTRVGAQYQGYTTERAAIEAALSRHRTFWEIPSQ